MGMLVTLSLIFMGITSYSCIFFFFNTTIKNAIMQKVCTQRKSWLNNYMIANFKTNALEIYQVKARAFDAEHDSFNWRVRMISGQRCATTLGATNACHWASVKESEDDSIGIAHHYIYPVMTRHTIKLGRTRFNASASFFRAGGDGKCPLSALSESVRTKLRQDCKGSWKVGFVWICGRRLEYEKMMCPAS